MINIDDVHDHFEGVAYLHPSENGLPGTIAYFDTKNKDPEQTLTAYTAPIDPRTGFQTTWEAIKELYPEGIFHSTEAKGQIKQVDNHLTVSTTTDIGVAFSAVLSRPDQQSESKITGQEMSWVEFKEHVSKIAGDGFIFRGQKEPWKLCTAFHRRGRYRIRAIGWAEETKPINRETICLTP